MNNLKTLSLAGCAGAAMLAATPAAAANRCGGSLAIDAATTLAEVASRCNVNLSDLYEANPGVDPRNVVPGTYLAMPDERQSFVAAGASDTSDSPPATDGQSHSGDYSDQATRVYDTRVSTRVRLRNVRLASDDPVWRREETSGGNRSFAADRRSYQKRSAARIHSAGVPTFSAPGNLQFRNSISATADGSETISCVTLQGDKAGHIRKVRKIISSPTNTFVEVEPAPGGGFNCTLIDMSSADDVAPTPGVPAAHFGLPQNLTAKSSRSYRLPDFNEINPKAAGDPQKIAISGNVIGEAGGCLMLDAGSAGKWALASAPGGDTLIGKHVRAWGVASQSGACGAAPTMIVSHAVYAEPWSGGR